VGLGRAIDAAASSVEAVLAVRNLSCSYGRRWVVRDVSFDMRIGETLALIGPSASGKTTVLRALNRLNELIPDAHVRGSLQLRGVPVQRGVLGADALRRRVGYVFQLPNPFPLSVFDNVALPLREHRLVADEDECTGRVHSLLERVGLLDELGGDLRGSALSLSGGQQQRLCIARALATDPDVILFDEPCSALDPRSTAVIEELITAMKATLGIAVVTHNLAQARRIADRVGFLLDGELVELGGREQVFQSPCDRRTRDYVNERFG
jgi:phosphate transport system ATP-binding protein